MKTKFWTLLLLIIAGAVAAGYGSGMYHGRMEAQKEAKAFLLEFNKSIDLNNYFEQKGQTNWSNRLAMYGDVGPNSHFRVRRKWTNLTLVGLLSFGIGLVGLIQLQSPKR